MEWLMCIRKTIEYIENHLEENISVQDVGNAVNVSSMFLSKGFTVMTGYGINEYIRNRRLYKAAIDLTTTDEKVIDISYKYAYDTPESFTKAFTRFHGSTPSQIRSKEGTIKTFLPLKINIRITGGFNMEYKIKKMTGLKIIGIAKDFEFSDAQKYIPDFWDEVFAKYANDLAFKENSIGEFGVCIDDYKNKKIHYLIGGAYQGGVVPAGMEVYDLPDGDYAIFDAYGPMPKAIQDLTNHIYNEWLPANPDFEITGNVEVEWYESGDMQAPDYHTQIWFPVKGNK